MAERRMFAKTIIDSDSFLDMPLSAQALYFHLSMRADDDGFVNNPKKIQRMIGASDDDCRLLIMKKYVLTFESGVIVIRHWKIHNYIQKDRYKETAFLQEKQLIEAQDNGTYEMKAMPLLEEQTDKTARQLAYEKSSLPYSFGYKIKTAFLGKKCPVCGCTMSYENNLVQPTIQHNVPISKGGEHELGNISVICASCNKSLRDTETGKLNADEVVEEWDKLTCTRNGYALDTQDSIGKVRIGKDSIGKDIDNSIYNNIQEQGGQKGGKNSTRERYRERERDKERDKDIEKERIDNNIYNISDQPENSSIPTSTTYGLEEFKRDNPQIEMDDYDGTIYSMDFEGLTQRIKESSWLQKVNKFSFFCYKYKKVMAGEYKDRPRRDSYQNEEPRQEEPKRIFKTCRI